MMKERILNSWKNIPVKNLANYIKNGVITISELKQAGLNDDKEYDINNMLVQYESELWNECKTSDKPKDYKSYIDKYPSGMHRDEALFRLKNLDDKYWEKAKQSLEEDVLREYSETFPKGTHIQDCEDYLLDLPWLQTRKKNTINDYNNYLLKYPGKHDQDIHDAINTLNDDNDWNNAEITHTTDAYKIYLNQHPNGNHINEAQIRIQANAGRDEFISNLKADANYYNVGQIQGKVNNNVIDWHDVEMILGVDETNAIKNYKGLSSLPQITLPPESLSSNSTEVYFWGTPSSGKTCALGAIISSVQNEGIFEPLDCAGYDYMTRLSNIFDKNGFCIFPPNSPVENIHEMKMIITDTKKKLHRITLVDLAGELFRSVYYIRHNLSSGDGSVNALNTALSYLKDQRNKKMHFFVVEYGGHNKDWEGMKMVNYLDNMVGYLKSEKIFRKSTVGVYILVTKCDIIDCEPEERPEKAFEYVQKELPSFYNTLKRTCEANGIKDLTILSFSVGKVFAQKICKFDGKDTHKVINKLILKTKPEGGFLDIFRK